MFATYFPAPGVITWLCRTLPSFRRARIENWNEREEFFRYSAGRWVFNEARQLAERSVRFDMNELARVTAACLGAGSCLNIEKLPEGNFNKAFLMTLDSGVQVVAKVSNPNAGRPHATTASEVATMDYARNTLDLPVPEVHAWNSRATINRVGAEYIIMDKVSGLELSRCWPKMRANQKLELLESLVQMERRFVSAPFPAIGSLYYKEDLDDDLPQRPLEQDHIGSKLEKKTFVVGPTTSRNFYDFGRGQVEFDRGPWSSARDYLKALGAREERCIEHLGITSHQLGLFGGPDSYKPTSASKISVLEDYSKIAGYLVPDNVATHSPVLWHGDLHMSNIFVDPDDPTKITGLIDWQATKIAPLFFQASQPHFIDFDGPRHQEMSVPRLPSNFGQLSPAEQKDAETLNLNQTLYKFYEVESRLRNRPVYDALRFQQTLKYQAIAYAASLLTGGEPRFKGKLIALTDAWEKVVGKDGPSCPLRYSDEDRREQEREEELWMMGYTNMLCVLGAIGDAQVGWDGWVEPCQYDAVREMVREARKSFLDQVGGDEEERRREWAKCWPFGDEEDLD